jgi:uncharacterized repeat protein (TIGR03803 family)
MCTALLLLLRRGFSLLLVLVLSTAVSLAQGRTSQGEDTPAISFKTLVSFDITNGEFPLAGLVQGKDGNFYGTTDEGGYYGAGNIFKITPSGNLMNVYSFCPLDSCLTGEVPQAPLIQSPSGIFYGTSAGGGTDGGGTIFGMTPTGAVTSLYSFCYGSSCTQQGLQPRGALLQTSNGDFYGTTEWGGTGKGIVFEITPEGKLTTIYNFCSQQNCADGANPMAGLVEGKDGNLYGTTAYGGVGGGAGTVFRVTPKGVLTVLSGFGDSGDGYYPQAGLLLARNGNFYGTTVYGGPYGGGTVFKITPQGSFTTIHSFCAQTSCVDGEGPVAGLMQASDGNLYGTTRNGGANDYGTIFRLSPAGALTTLHSFTSNDGANPYGALIQSKNGEFYGTTEIGGARGVGTVFTFSLGLGPQ